MEPLNPPNSEITSLLGRWQNGEGEAAGELMHRVYEQLKILARRAMRRERDDHTLQATALVHEVFLRLAEGTPPDWNDRRHFFAVAARLMRHILVDHARGLRTERRGGEWHRLTLGALEHADLPKRPEADLLDLDRALDELTEIDPRKAQVIELRHFAGLSVAEAAQVLDVSQPTIILDTRLGRAWLSRRLGLGSGTHGTSPS